MKKPLPEEYKKFVEWYLEKIVPMGGTKPSFYTINGCVGMWWNVLRASKEDRIFQNLDVVLEGIKSFAQDDKKYISSFPGLLSKSKDDGRPGIVRAFEEGRKKLDSSSLSEQKYPTFRAERNE